MPLAIEHIVHDNDVRTEAEANRRREARVRGGDGAGADGRVRPAGSRHGPVLYAVDTMARVVDEWAGIDEAMHVTGRTFMRSRKRTEHHHDGASERRGSIVL